MLNRRLLDGDTHRRESSSDLANPLISTESGESGGYRFVNASAGHSTVCSIPFTSASDTLQLRRGTPVRVSYSLFVRLCVGARDYSRMAETIGSAASAGPGA